MKIYTSNAFILGTFLVNVYASSLDFKINFAVNKPAFVTSLDRKIDDTTGNHTKSLFISSFGVSLFGKPPDAVQIIPDITKSYAQKSFDLQSIEDTVLWPNEVSFIDQQLFVAGGFLVPGKKGHISYMEVSKALGEWSSAKWTRLIENDKGFFHTVQKLKILPVTESDDGFRFVTCRGYKGIFDNGGGEMVYFEPLAEGGYQEKFIFKGCDVFFSPVDFNGDGVIEFVVPAFFGKKLLLVWTEDVNGDYSKSEFVKTRVIDAEIGMAFNAQVVDMNSDGVLDIIATNHQAEKAKIKPSVFVYTTTLPKTDEFSQPQQFILSSAKFLSTSPVSKFMNGIKFEKQVIATDFPVRRGNFNAAAPGGPSVVNTRADGKGDQVVLLSGDDAGKAYLLTHSSSGNTFDIREFHDCEGTVGGIHVTDVDEDGWNEVFVPCYERDYVSVFSFKE